MFYINNNIFVMICQLPPQNNFKGGVIMPKANADIREMLKEKQIPVYAVAAVMGVHENTVFRRLRFELPDNDKTEFIRIINELAARNNNE